MHPDDDLPHLGAVVPDAGTSVALRRVREDRATVVRVDGEDLIIAVAPDDAAQLHTGTAVDVRIGADDGAAWLVTGEVAGVLFTDAGPVHVRLHPDGPPRREQERRHVRIPAFDLELRLRTQLPGAGADWFAGTGFDISAGGIRFSTTRALQPGDLVDVRADLPSDRRPVELLQEAVIVWASNGPGARVAQYALRFTHLSRTDEDRIVAWVLERQTHRPRPV